MKGVRLLRSRRLGPTGSSEPLLNDSPRLLLSHSVTTDSATKMSGGVENEDVASRDNVGPSFEKANIDIENQR